MNDLSITVERLATRIETLEQRIAALENSRHAESPILPPPLTPPLLAAGERSVSGAEPGVFAVLGKAMLCIAGAYLLRAAVQSAALPRWPAIIAAIVWAFVWLVPATRVAARAWFNSAVWAGTSALILVPMLWEFTLRFHFLPATASAAILGAFVIAAAALAWNRHFAAVSWTADAAASLAALVLGIATRDLVPFLVVLLVMAILSETAAALRRAPGVRLLTAIAADCALFALIWIYSGPPGSHAEYPPLPTSVLLAFAPAALLVYAGSAAIRTLILRQAIDSFHTAQSLLAALLTVWSIIAFWPGRDTVALGATCLIASAAGYALAFAWFQRTHARRNYHVYATGSLALLLGGILLSLPAPWVPLCAGLLAVAMVLLGRRFAQPALLFHGLALLATAAWFSGLFASIGSSMVGAPPPTPGWIVSLAGASAILCFAGLPRTGLGPWWEQVLHLFFAAIAVAALIVFLVWFAVRLAATVAAPGVQHVAVIRTFAICAVALTLAWCGSLWKRKELVWLTWTALALTAAKLLLEDLRLGQLGFTATSISLYAVTLLLVPRLLRVRSAAIRHGSV